MKLIAIVLEVIKRFQIYADDFFVFTRQIQDLLCRCEDQTANPFPDIILIKDIDIGFCILKRDFIGRNHIFQYVFNNEISFQLILSCNNFMTLTRFLFFIILMVLASGNVVRILSITFCFSCVLDFVVHHLSYVLIQRFFDNGPKFFYYILGFYAFID